MEASLAISGKSLAATGMKGIEGWAERVMERIILPLRFDDSLATTNSGFAEEVCG